MRYFTTYDLQRRADDIVRKSPTTAIRRKCFISYHRADLDEVAQFIEDFGHVFIPQVIGVSEDDPFVDSTNSDYIYDQIREKYITNSTVTIVMIGQCTWSRKFVDWEIASTLRNDPVNKRGGLMAITLPSMANDSSRRLPDRLSDNIYGVDGDEGYARWWKYSKTAEGLRQCIETAFAHRTTREHLVENARSRRLRSASCP